MSTPGTASFGEGMVSAWVIAERLDVTTDTVLTWWRKGLIPGFRIPGQVRPVRFIWADVLAALDDRSTEAANDDSESVE